MQEEPEGGVPSLVSLCVGKLAQHIHYVDFTDVPSYVVGQVLTLLRKHKQLTTNTLNIVLSTANEFASESLDLSSCWCITNNALARVAKIPSLACIDLSSNGCISVKGIEILKSVKNLRRLYVSDCDKIDDRALALVAKTWPYLEGLKIANCPLITKQALVSLAKLEDLQILDISECKKLSGTSFSFLTKLTRLEELYVGGYSRSPTNLRTWSTDKLTRLTYLCLSGSQFYYEVVARGKERKKKEKAEEDGVAEDPIKEEESKKKKGEKEESPGLLHLNLSGCNFHPTSIDDRPCPLLSYQPQLLTLNLLGCYFPARFLIATLDNLPNLESLSVGCGILKNGDNPNLLDEDFFQRDVLPASLRYLEISEAYRGAILSDMLTDEHLDDLANEALASCPRFQTLVLKYHRKITERGLNAVRSRVPTVICLHCVKIAS